MVINMSDVLMVKTYNGNDKEDYCFAITLQRYPTSAPAWSLPLQPLPLTAVCEQFLTAETIAGVLLQAPVPPPPPPPSVII